MRRSGTIVDGLTVVTLVTLGLALAACGSSSKGATAPATSANSTTTPAAGGSSSDICKLLTDDEVTGVIGAHTKGVTGILAGGEYGPDSCVWKSTNTSGTSVDSTEVALLSGPDAADARADAARAEPLAAFGHDARYDKSYSRLWFACGNGSECQVRVATGSVTTHDGQTREDAAMKLASAVLTRV
jgi:hypothetical protein